LIYILQPKNEVVTERQRPDPKITTLSQQTFAKPPEQNLNFVNKNQDYEDIEIITAPPPSQKAYGQSFEVKVSFIFR